MVPAYPGSPGKRAVKRVCVCVQILILGQVMPTDRSSKLTTGGSTDEPRHPILEEHGYRVMKQLGQGQSSTANYDTIRYDTRCYINVRSKADMSQLNLPHGNDN